MFSVKIGRNMYLVASVVVPESVVKIARVLVRLCLLGLFVYLPRTGHRAVPTYCNQLP